MLDKDDVIFVTIVLNSDGVPRGLERDTRTGLGKGSRRQHFITPDQRNAEHTDDHHSVEMVNVRQDTGA